MDTAGNSTSGTKAAGIKARVRFTEADKDEDALTLTHEIIGLAQEDKRSQATRHRRARMTVNDDEQKSVQFQLDTGDRATSNILPEADGHNWQSLIFHWRLPATSIGACTSNLLHKSSGQVDPVKFHVVKDGAASLT